MHDNELSTATAHRCDGIFASHFHNPDSFPAELLRAPWRYKIHIVIGKDDQPNMALDFTMSDSIKGRDWSRIAAELSVFAFDGRQSVYWTVESARDGAISDDKHQGSVSTVKEAFEIITALIAELRKMPVPDTAAEAEARRAERREAMIDDAKSAIAEAQTDFIREMRLKSFIDRYGFNPDESGLAVAAE